MKRPLWLVLLLVACASSPMFRPRGAWKEGRKRLSAGSDSFVWSQERGKVAVSVNAPRLDDAGVLRMLVWIENRTVDLVESDPSEALLIEPGGTTRQNMAPSEKRHVPKVGDERFAGEFELSDPARVLAEGFTIRMKLTPLNPVPESPITVEMRFAPSR